MMRNFIFSSPGKYVQGSGVLDELGVICRLWAARRFLLQVTRCGQSLKPESSRL